MGDKNPYEDLVNDATGGGGGGGGGGGEGGGNQSSNLYQAQFDSSDEEDIASGFGYDEIFGKVSEYWALNAPDTVMKISLPENQIYQQAALQSLEYLQLIYGPQLAPTLQAALIQSPEKRQYAYEVLKQIAQAPEAATYGHPIGVAQENAPQEQTVDAELMSRVISNPDILETLGPETRNKVIEQARLAGKALQPTGDPAKQFFYMTGQTATGNYDVFMNDKERAALEQVLSFASQGEAPTPAGAGRGNPLVGRREATFSSIGVAEVQNAGAPNPTIILDEEWARARPVRAAAVMDYLRTQLPDVAFRVGEKGFVGKTLDVLGKGVDFVSAIPGAAVGVAGEVIDKAVHSDDDRAQLAREADELERKLKDGEVKPEDWDDTMRTIAHLRDNAETDIQYEFGERIDNNLHPREAGYGFAENFTEALDLMPGDPGYDFAYAASGLAANIVFDPLNYILPGVGGIKAAKHGVAGAAELAGKVDYGLDAFRTMGDVADASRVARASVSGILPAAPKTVEEVIGKGRYVLLPAIDEDLPKVLKARGYNFGKATLNGEDAILVPKVTLEEGIHLAREAGISTFMSTEGLVDVGTRSVREVKKVLTTTENASDIASFGGKSWGYSLERGATKLRPERIAGGYTKNYLYRKFVKTPDEWITTKPAREAVHKMWVTRQAVGRERFLARVQRLFNVDARVARVLANARNEDDMLMAMHAAMTGNMSAPFNQARNAQRLEAVVERLNEGDALRAGGDETLPRLLELEATRADDVAEAAFLRSLNSGRDFQLSLRDLPSSRQWRGFMGKEGRSIAGRSLVSMAEFAERFPGNLIGMGPKRLGRWLMTPEGRVAEKSAKQASIGLGRWFGSHGAGSRIHFPWAARAEGELADSVIESAGNVRDFLKTFAVPNDRAEELVGRFLDIKNQRQSFEWTKDFWYTISDDSPLLASTGRAQIRDIWPDLFNERAPGYVTKSKPGEFVQTESTLFRVETDEAGNLFKPGVPAFTADMLHSIRLPEIDQVLDLISFNRRMLRNWSKAGGARQPIAKAMMQGQRGWEAFARLWKSSVLLFKMPLALPLRIIGEEHLRIAAFDEASLVNHPIAWFKSTRVGGKVMSVNEMALFAESNAAHLGLLGDQFLSRVRMVKPGRHIVSIKDGELYYRAASTKVAKLAKSPEVARWYVGKSPKEALAVMESGEGLALGSGDILNLWDEVADPKGIKNRLEAVKRVKMELDQLSGGNEKIEAAMKTGQMTNEAGEVVLAGTEQFQAELARMHAAGEWEPKALEIPASSYEFEFTDSKRYLADFRDKMFNYFYTKPDVALARSPLFRSVATREYRRLRSLGWQEGKAIEGGQAYAARRVSDMLYRIGETSSAHHFLRNIAPFFPAFQELTNTWLVRVPKAMGGGFWAPGAVRLARKADAFFDFFKQMGWVEKNADGEWTVPIPFLGRIVAALTGSPVPLNAHANLSSFTGVLPDPFSGVKGLLPGLGAPSSAILSEAAERWDGVIDTFADYLLPFGREVSLGPAAVDRLMMAAGIEPPWVFGSPDYQKSLKAYAIDDAIRMELTHGSKPRELFIRDKRLRASTIAAVKAWNEAVGFEVFRIVNKRGEGVTDVTVVGPDYIREEAGANATIGGGIVRVKDVALGDLSIMEHELGHILGIEHTPSGLMAEGYPGGQKIGPRDIAKVREMYAQVPKREWYDSDDQFNKAYQRWSEGVVSRAERSSSLMFAVRGVSSLVLPFSAQYDTSYDTEMAQIWAQLSTLPGGGGELTGPALDAFKAAHPEAVWYTNGKTINLSDDRNFSRTDSFAQEWTDQMRDVLKPDEFLRWVVGMQSYSVYSNKLDRAYSALGNTPAEVLLNGFERFDTITPLKAEWQDYLDWTDSVTPAGQRSFHDLFKEWRKARGYDESELTKEQEDILGVKQNFAELAGIFTEGGIRNASYKEVQGMLTEALGNMDLPSSSPVAQGVNWWWKNVGKPYGNKVSKIYDRLSMTDDPFVRGQAYEQLRRIANRAPHETYNGVKMPTPEEVFFGNLSPQEKQARRLDWASLPVEWLTNFQMEQIGLKAGPKLEQLATFVNENEYAFDRVVATNDIHPASNDYESLRRAFDIRALEKAQSLGLTQEYAFMRKPAFQRIDQLFGQDFNNETWNRVVSMASQANTAIEGAQEGSIGATRDAAMKWVVDYVREVSAKDENFRGIMDQLAVAYAPSGKDRMTPDLLVLKLFFNWWDDKVPTSLYV